MKTFLRSLFATMLLVALLPLACVSDHGGNLQAGNSEVLDTSSPDEPRFDSPGNVSAAAAAQTLFLRESDSNKRIANVALEGTSYTGPIVVSSARDTLSNIVYYNWSLSCDYAAGDNTRWGALLYNEVNCRYVEWRVEGIKGEHAIYQHSPRGDVLLRGVHCFDIGAQGFQQVWRGSETSDPLGWKVVGTHRLENCSFNKCGQPRGYGRASYAVSMFGRQAWDGSSPREPWDCPVELDSVTIEHDSQGQYELRGALLVEWRPSVWINACRINYVGTADRDLVHLYQDETVLVENSYIHGSRPFDIDGSRVKSVRFTSPDFDGGDTKVRINGVVVGTTDDEIDWHK